MPKLDLQMEGFYSELEKQAFSPAVGRALGGIGAGAGAGAVIGAGLGGAVGGVQSYRRARQEGQSAGGAALSGVGGALSHMGGGAMKGALVGAAGLGTAAAMGKAPALAGRLTQMGGPLGVGARSGQRQVHALTGWTPDAGIQSIRGGAYSAAQRLDKAKKAVGPEAASELAAATKAHGAADKAEKMGLTSLPGYAKALFNKDTGGLVGNAGKVIRTGAAEQWHAGGAANKAMMVGVPAAALAGEVSRKSEPGGPGKLERVGRHLGELGMMMGPIPMAGQMVAGAALSGAGGRLGRALDKTKKPTPPVSHEMPPAGNETMAAENVVSDRASGNIGSVQ